MRILITGSEGQLGRDLQSVLCHSHALVCMPRTQLDIGDARAVRDILVSARADLVVNAAAFTKVDEAEAHPEEAMRVNAHGPAILATACREHQARFIHLSTDYVFDGAKTPPDAYRESDPPRPVNVYGQSKLAGEAAAMDACPDTAVLRTAWLYGHHGANFLRSIFTQAIRHPDRPLRICDDQIGCPTWSGRLARQIARLIEDFRPGLFHAAAEGATDRHSLARRFLDAADIPCRLSRCATRELLLPAPRPANTALENTALRAAGLHVMMPWEKDLDAFAELVRDPWRQAITPP